MLRVGIVAGEASGDALAAALIRSLKQKLPDISFSGIAGPQMIAAGCQPLFAAERLSVMGIAEVLGRLRELLAIRRKLIEHFLANPPDVFIGVDAPDFNLGVERALHDAGIATVHYVSPSVWAWREKRVTKISAGADLVLSLFPFEPAIYQRYGASAEFVGHPLADEISASDTAGSAREKLGLDPGKPMVALLPGSRITEVSRLAKIFIDTAVWLSGRMPGLQFVAPMASDELKAYFSRLLPAGLQVKVLDGDARTAITAADVALAASGTVTLEALLLQRPMVVSYRVAPVTAYLVKWLRLLKISRFALPNILAGRDIVPELMQAEARPDILGPAVLELLTNAERRAAQVEAFKEIGERLRCNASERAADAVLKLIQTGAKQPAAKL